MFGFALEKKALVGKVKKTKRENAHEIVNLKMQYFV